MLLNMKYATFMNCTAAGDVVRMKFVYLQPSTCLSTGSGTILQVQTLQIDDRSYSVGHFL